MRRAAALLAALALALSLAACTDRPNPASSAIPTPAVASPKPPAGLARYYDQKLDWHSCGDNACAWLRVPLDYAHPRGRSIKIGVLKVAATDQAHRLGALVVNPGGPGASGMNFALYGAGGYFRSALTSRYDIVGFDPRGVGQSAPIDCGDTAQTDAMVNSDPAPRTASQWKQAVKTARAYMERCVQLSGAVAKHVSTVEAARDMDILRAALGDSRLHYFGASYGTFLGATYASLFPKRVGRMVLDGALDPSLSTTQMAVQQAQGMQVALDAYVADCVAGGSCPLGSTTKAATARVGALLDEVRKHPLPTGTSRPLTAGLMTLGVWQPLYVKSDWPNLTAAFAEVIDQRSGSKFLAMADTYIGRGSQGYSDNSLAAQTAVNCLDEGDPMTWQQARTMTKRFLKASPTFGRAFAPMPASCEFYPVHHHQAPRAIRAKGAPPIVVIGTTRDPATPLRWAKALAGELDSGVLVTRDGDGHTAYSQGNQCINDTVENYLVKGTVPRNGLAC